MDESREEEMKILALVLYFWSVAALADSEVRYVELEDCHWSFVQEGPRYYRVSVTAHDRSSLAVEDMFTGKVYFVLGTSRTAYEDFLYFDRFECQLVRKT